MHCEKNLFVLASRQKIPVLRPENPAVDTRTICLLPIEFFFKLPMPEKLWPENPGQKQQIRPENTGLLVPENVRPENRRPENSAASNCRYGRKISASNYQIRPEIRLPVTTETARKSGLGTQ